MNEVESMIASVRDVVEVDRAEAWFEAVVAAYEQGTEGWTSFTESLATTARDKSFGDEVVEAFVRYADDNESDPMGIVRQMCEYKSELPGWYASLVSPEATAEPTDTDEGAETDEWDAETAAQWYEYFTTSNDWAGWTGGGEAEWDQFKQWFLYYAELQQAQEPAATFLERVESDSDGYAAGLAAYGIHAVEAASEAPVEEPAGWGESTSARHEALTIGKGWGGWTGAEEDWEPFTQWFLYYAGEDGDAEQAQAFLTEAEASGDKLAVFAAYGITLAEPAEPAEPEAAAAEPTGPIEVSAVEMQAAVDQVLEEFPEFADIPEARRRELMEEVRRELAEAG